MALKPLRNTKREGGGEDGFVGGYAAALFLVPPPEKKGGKKLRECAKQQRRAGEGGKKLVHMLTCSILLSSPLPRGEGQSGSPSLSHPPPFFSSSLLMSGKVHNRGRLLLLLLLLGATVPPSLPSPPLGATPREGEYEAETTKKGRRELRRRRGREHVVTPGRSRRGEENFQENCQNITCGAACPGPRPSVRLSPLPSIPRGGVIIPRPFRRAAAAAAARLYGEREEEKEATMRTHLLSDERRAALAMHPP